MPGQLVHQVIGIQHCIFGSFGDALLAQRQQIGQRPHHNGKVAVEAAHPAQRVFRREEAVPVVLVLHAGTRQKLLQKCLAAHRTAAGTAAAVGRGEGLVQVQVHAVKAHVAGTGMAHHRVQVGAVVVAQAACLVDNSGDFQNVRVKQAQRVGVGQHQAGGIGADGGFQGIQIHAALGVGRHRHHGEACHRRRGRVGAVGGIRNQNLGAGGVPAGLVVAADQQQAGVLAVGAGCRLHGHAGHAGDFTQQLFGAEQHLQRALGGLGRLQRMQLGKSRQRGQGLIDPGIVFHGAGTQRIKSVIDAVGLLGKLGIMPVQIHLGQFRQARRLGTQHIGIKDRRRRIAGGQVFHAPAGVGPFKQQLHRATPPEWQ